MNERNRGGDDGAAQPPGMPRWVKVSGLLVLAVAAVLVVIMLLSGGDHGPRLHTGAGDLIRTSLVVRAAGL